MDDTNLPSLVCLIQEWGLLSNKNFSKKLGQNFLLDQNITDKIVRYAGSLKDITVIEIGPGVGGLTRSILQKQPKELYVIERDPQCVKALQSLKHVSKDRLTILEADALKITPQDIATSPIKIIANLPYNIGTLLLLKWLRNLEGIESLTLMFQKEVAVRILAQPNTHEYGRLSVICQYLCKIDLGFTLPPKAFTPPPKVSSCVIHLKPNHLSVDELSLLPYLEKVTAAAFNQRRKMIRKSLRTMFAEEKIEKIFKDLSLDPTLRAENLTLKDYQNLALAYCQSC